MTAEVDIVKHDFLKVDQAAQSVIERGVDRSVFAVGSRWATEAQTAECEDQPGVRQSDEH